MAEPKQCEVGCTTCANICPTQAIHFPSLDQVVEILSRPEVRSSIDAELLSRQDQVGVHGILPHPDRIVRLIVESTDCVGKRNVVLGLKPKTSTDGLCQFTPGDYLEIWSPESPWIARAYSIDNAPRDDGRVEVQLRRIPKGRLAATGAARRATGRRRGPGQRASWALPHPLPDRRAALVHRDGSAFAPVRAMIEQQLRLVPNRDIALFWRVATTEDFHDLDRLRESGALESSLRGGAVRNASGGRVHSPRGPLVRDRIDPRRARSPRRNRSHEPRRVPGGTAPVQHHGAGCAGSSWYLAGSGRGRDDRRLTGRCSGKPRPRRRGGRD